MKKLHTIFTIAAAAVLSIFTACSGLNSSKIIEAAKKSSNKGIYINIGKTAERTVSPVTFVTDNLSSITSWTVKITNENDETFECKCSTTDSSDENLYVPLKITGTDCTIELSGSYVYGGDTIAVKGAISGVNLKEETKYFTIDVDTVKEGTGSFSYKLYLDETEWIWNNIGDYLGDYGAPGDTEGTYGEDIAMDFNKENGYEGNRTKTNFAATLTPVSTSGSAVELTCTEYYHVWTETGSDKSENVFSYLEIAAEKVPAGTYELYVTIENSEEATTEADATTNVANIEISDNVVEIYGDKATTGESTVYYYDTEKTPDYYYATNENSGKGYNGLAPNSRINFTDLVKSMIDSGKEDVVISVYFANDELADIKDWDFWKTWKQQIGIMICDETGNEVYDGDDFYLGNYRTLFASASATESGTGLESTSPLKITDISENITSAGYTVYISDISTTSEYADSIIPELTKSNYDIANIVLQQTSDCSNEFYSWKWENSEINGTLPKYGLTLGTGISIASISEDAYLTSLTFGDDFTRISYYSFQNCTALTTVNIGINVEEISYEAFTGCSAINTVNFPAPDKYVWFTTSGTQLSEDDIANFTGILEKETLERVAAPTYLDTPYAIWSGTTDSLLNSFYATDAVCKYTVPLANIANVTDFVFDENGNLYASIKLDNNSYNVNKYIYNSHTLDTTNLTTPVNTANSPILYSDVDNGLIYAAAPKNERNQITSIKSDNTTTSYTSADGVSLDFDNFAVKDNFVYTVSDNTVISLSYNLSEGKITANTSNFSVGVSDLDSEKTGIKTDEYTTITDLQVVGNYLYVLISSRNTEKNDGLYSRGALLKYEITTATGELTYNNSTGWYNENTALDLTSESTSVTLDEFKASYFAGPVRFVAVKPEKLVIADDGGYLISNSFNNINRVVIINLESLAINESYDVDATFDFTVTGYNGSCDFNNGYFIEN